jgi:ATP-dependent protease Clp ATPase subunit
VEKAEKGIVYIDEIIGNDIDGVKQEKPITPIGFIY